MTRSKIAPITLLCWKSFLNHEIYWRMHWTLVVSRFFNRHFNTFKFSVPQGAPQNFSAVGLTETSVRLAWDLPAYKLRNGDIVSYQLIFYKLADSINVEEINITGLQYDVTNLDMNTDYVFQIKAYTVKGAGPWSSRLQYRTFGKRRFKSLCMIFLKTNNCIEQFQYWHKQSYWTPVWLELTPKFDSYVELLKVEYLNKF